MMYFRMYVRGHWSKVHYTSDAGLRTLCGRVIAGVQAETTISADKLAGPVCSRCAKRLERDGEVAWR